MTGVKKLAGRAVVASVLFWSSAAQAQDPARLTCQRKSFPNLEGQTALSLVRQANGSYVATFEDYGPAKKRKALTCRFGADPFVFSCLAVHANWGLFGKKVVETSLDDEGNTVTANVYDLEAVKAPQGEPLTEKSFRFDWEACKVER